MTPSIESKFNHYYSLHCKHLKLKGLQPKTIEAYSRAIRRMGEYFEGDLENLSQDQLLDYFHDLLARLSCRSIAPSVDIKPSCRIPAVTVAVLIASIMNLSSGLRGSCKKGARSVFYDHLYLASSVTAVGLATATIDLSPDV